MVDDNSYNSTVYHVKSTNCNGISAISAITDIIIRPYGGSEIIKITKEGDIFWRGKLVESNDEFKTAMMDLKVALCNTRAD